MSQIDLPKTLKADSILKAASIYEKKGAPDGFLDNTTYKVVIDGKEYPPKVIVYYAVNEELREYPKAFQGGWKSGCFGLLRDAGFKLINKSTVRPEYAHLEQSVYDYLMTKHKADNNFTFSLRKKASKGAEMDYFIGTSKSNYSAFTLWEIPVSYPGSSGDLTGFIIEGLAPDHFMIRFDYNTSRENDLEPGNIEFGKQLQVLVNKEEWNYTHSSDDAKQFSFYIRLHKGGYKSIAELLTGLQEYITTVVPLVEIAVGKTKEIYPAWVGHRISPKEFDVNHSKMIERIDKYAKVFEDVKKDDEIIWHKEKIQLVLNVNPNKSIFWNSNFTSTFNLPTFINRVDLKIGGGLFENIELVAGGHLYFDKPLDYQLLTNEVIKHHSEYDFIELEVGYSVKHKFETEEEKVISIYNRVGYNGIVQYYHFVDGIIRELNIKNGDDRVVFNLTHSNRLGLTVGQCYSVVIEAKISETKFHYIDITKSNVNKFSTATNWEEVINSKQNIIDASKNEISKVKTKSSYKASHSKCVERSFFDTNYRNELFEKAFGIDATKEITMKTLPINEILYGPPGTGKTYKLKSEYFPKYTSKETSITKEKHLETVVSACSWWQVVGVALLELGKAKVSDIFDHAWVKEKARLSNSKTVRPTLWGQLQAHTVEECEFVNVKRRMEPSIFNKTEDSYWEILHDNVEEQIPELFELLKSVNEFTPNPDKEIKRYKFVTFHQSYGYEDFIEGIKPIMTDESGDSSDIGYQIVPGIFKELCTLAERDPENQYAIFIDEINRGNVSAIFGELITLIELDKRKGGKNPMYAELPYTKDEPFIVPSNIDIYGTMNTADRSVEALDTALRRRFTFKEMLPDVKVIEKEKVGAISMATVLKTINERIELLIDRDHTIGHSYFIGVNTKEKLLVAFRDKVIPLLQEYFYGDYGKIGLVLGSGFVELKESKGVKFAKMKGYENAEDLKQDQFVLKDLDIDGIVDAVAGISSPLLAQSSMS